MLNLPPLALYIHLPWCERKCPYCDFNSYQHESEPPYAAYATRLLEDLDAEAPRVEGREIVSIFFGGGTPSLFPPAQIARILEGVAARVPLAPEAEITLEANPGSSERARFSALREAGVNRLSLGIQSFSDDSLRALGRVHDAHDARVAISAARAAGFLDLNLDLMHGLPGQSPGLAIADLAEAIQNEPSHLSWYQLTLEPNTAFYSAPPELPDDDVLAEIQDRGEELLARHGYSQYEVSAWSQPGARCEHNLNYWRFGDYLGIGAGAHGKLSFPDTGQIVRVRKTRSPRDYLAQAAGELRVVETVPPGERVFEFMLNALRLSDGVESSLFVARTGLSQDAIATRVERLQDEGLMQHWPGRIATTRRGLRFLNHVLERFA